ncbi:glycoside hydrolase family 65 protein [Paenibacillus sp. MER 180]|uniref:glycoside hydrolase family 65 protein n=1 Tax=Paenibacillus sp. MER 180 TaxID=2939570 RepID=UPI00203CF97A|nr:glycosyl hydrolase family 65 protein [Paenibacillus sp. MER 180]MCM3289503.1 glycoside hydrolase family 65 protein [Paenibacillus sp. MER 180]
MLNYNAILPDVGENWAFMEEKFDPLRLGKCESIMSLGNGYMGLRAVTEEPYLGETRNLFVNGTFNKFDEREVSELPNAADVTRLDMCIDGRRFSLETGKVEDYSRTLNLRHAELVRTFIWENDEGKRMRFTFRRFVSLDQLHLIGMKVEVTPLNEAVRLQVTSGINAQLTNTGSQHFHEGEKRIFDKQYIQLLQTTTQSQIDFVLHASHRFKLNGEALDLVPKMDIHRRKAALSYEIDIPAGSTLTLEKLSTIYTSRDSEFTKNDGLATLKAVALGRIKLADAQGYDALFEQHKREWAKVWEKYDIHIDSDQSFDVLALRFAIYHLVAMTPAHDHRMGIGAKGLSGEGYKGHSFWDTEIFILPFYIYSSPEIARSLLEYRYLGLEGARRKAKENGFEGAMYPWEQAWPSDGEVTPVWGDVDVVTGLQTKIWSGFIEQHITSDITYAVWHYYQATGDQDFMDRFGYEMIFDTAVFWASRLEWDDNKGRYHINEVIGPDEYKEHVNNNAFTNYMAHFNMELAIQYYDVLQAKQPRLLQQLDDKLGLQAAYANWISKIDNIYLPQPNAEQIVPQDDTYLSKSLIDLSKYKRQEKVGSIFLDYSLDQINQLQVSKQADIMMLFFLLENKFSPEVKKANYEYYEPKTLHDSSLSLSTHSILAGDFGDEELAYSLFRKATEIDLGPNMISSDAGIHSASIGGIWKCVVMGFAGLRMLDGKLHLNPSLPKAWSRLEFPFYWHGSRLLIQITRDAVRIKSSGAEEIALTICGREILITRELNVSLHSDIADIGAGSI